MNPPPSSSASTALQGASLAFQKNSTPKLKPPPPVKKNAALLAATGASSSSSSLAERQGSPGKRSLSRQTSSGTLNKGAGYEYSRAVESGAVERRLSVLSTASGHLSPWREAVDQKSPSFIAATLAASRSASPTPRGRSPRRAGETEEQQSFFAGAGPLISMFESGGRQPATSRDSSLTRGSAGGDVSRRVVTSGPRPPLSTIPSAQTVVTEHAIQAARQVGPKAASGPTSPLKSPTILSPTRPVLMSSKRPPTPPKPRGGIAKSASRSMASGANGAHSDTEMEREREQRLSRRETAGTVSSDDTFVSASSIQGQPREASLYSAPASPTRRPLPGPPIPMSTRPGLPPRRNQGPSTPTQSSLHITNLSNAIVASSLASARLTPHNTGNSVLSPPSRPRSPHLKPTLRKQRDSSSEDERSKERRKVRNHKFRGKKHVHHEGSRKRWRDRITDRERKRYEAVWASNRGYLVPNDDEHVVNAVVREIWKRSRLPDDELAEVWDLVDAPRRGALGRKGFVVGMWLVDQRLRGRKIPAKVSESVWDSVETVRLRGPGRK